MSRASAKNKKRPPSVKIKDEAAYFYAVPRYHLILLHKQYTRRSDNADQTSATTGVSVPRRCSKAKRRSVTCGEAHSSGKTAGTSLSDAEKTDSRLHHRIYIKYTTKIQKKQGVM